MTNKNATTDKTPPAAPKRRRARRFQGRRLANWWRSHGDLQWVALGCLGVAAGVLGMLGMQKALPGRPLSDTFYSTLQIFFLNYSPSGSAGTSILELQISQWLAAFFTLTAVVKAFMVVFDDQIQHLRLRWVRKHAIVCGDNRLAAALAANLCEGGLNVSGGPVVFVTNDEGEVRGVARDGGALTLHGNPGDPELLRIARARRATRILALCSDDNANLLVADQIAELASTSGKPEDQPECWVHIGNRALLSLFREHLAAKPGTDGRLHCFSIYEIGAMAFFLTVPPANEQQAAAGAAPHALVIGLGNLGESIVLLAARWGALLARQTKGGRASRIRVSVIDADAERRTRSLVAAFPWIEKHCDLRALPVDVRSEAFIQGTFLTSDDDDPAPAPTACYVCLDNDSLGFRTTSALVRRAAWIQCPIAVRIESTQVRKVFDLIREDVSCSPAMMPVSLSDALEHAGERVSNCVQPITAVSVEDEGTRPESVLRGEIELIGRAIHLCYILRETAKGVPFGQDYVVSWDDLPDDLRSANIAQAMDIDHKLKAAHCERIALAEWDGELFEFSPEELEALAKWEHVRWMDQRASQGWTFAPVRNNDLKHHPSMIPYEELSEGEKEKDRDAVRDLPGYLLLAGWLVRRRGERHAAGKRTAIASGQREKAATV